MPTRDAGHPGVANMKAGPGPYPYRGRGGLGGRNTENRFLIERGGNMREKETVEGVRKEGRRETGRE